MEVSHRSNYMLSELEQKALVKYDIQSHPYGEPLTYNNMYDKLTNEMEKNGVPEPNKPILIGPSKNFDLSPTSYP